MYWVYVLSYYGADSNVHVYYVGQTKRLFRRLREHCEGRGGVNTSDCYAPLGYCLEALYKVDSNIRIMNELNETIIDVYDFENYITKQYMKPLVAYEGIHKVRGGGYIRKKVNINNINFGNTVRPKCECGK